MLYKVKSLLEAFDDGDIDMMGHQANCFCMMGSGIAPLIAKQFPEMQEVDNMTVPGDPKKLGFFTSAKVSRKCDLVGVGINLYGQYRGGVTPDIYNVEGSVFHNADRYEPLRHALRALNFALYDSLVSESQRFRIGFPLMGCGIAGGDWATVERIIDEEMTNADVVICVLSVSDLPDWVTEPA